MWNDSKRGRAERVRWRKTLRESEEEREKEKQRDGGMEGETDHDRKIVPPGLKTK